MTDDDAVVSCVTLTGSEYVAMLARGAELAKEITSLLNRLADERTENMRLRAALEDIASECLAALRASGGNYHIHAFRHMALTALAAQPAPSGWRPIETAPKDKTRVIVAKYGAHSPLHEKAGDCWWACKAYFDGDCWTDGMDDLCTPTHWMPLPPAPGKEEA